MILNILQEMVSQKLLLTKVVFLFAIVVHELWNLILSDTNFPVSLYWGRTCVYVASIHFLRMEGERKKGMPVGSAYSPDGLFAISHDSLALMFTYSRYKCTIVKVIRLYTFMHHIKKSNGIYGS